MENVKQLLILDRKLSIKDIISTNKVIPVQDIISPQKTSFEIKKTDNIVIGDLIVLKNDNDIEYIGIVQDIETDITMKIATYPLISITDMECIMSNINGNVFSWIKDVFEYNIVNTLTDASTSNQVDNLLAIPLSFVDNTKAKTLQLEVSNGNFYDVLIDIFKKTGIYLTFDLHFVDHKISDILVNVNISDEETSMVLRYDNPIIFEEPIIENSQNQNNNKIIFVPSADNTTSNARYNYVFYLLDDNTVTNNPNGTETGKRINGVKQTIVEYSEEDYRKGLQKIAEENLLGNTLDHQITIKILQNDSFNVKLYDKIKFINKVKVYDTYVTKIENYNDKYKVIRLGVLRTTLTDKIKNLEKLIAKKSLGQISGGGGSSGSSVNVYNGLDSDSTTDALSAKQGKVLNEKITDLETNKVSRVTDEQPRYRFYGVKYNSTEDNVFNAYPGSAVKNWLAMYNSNGTLSAKDPTGDAHLTTKLYVDNAVSTIPKFSVEVVSSLPTENISTTTVYLVPSGSEEQNLYIEYIYVNDTWEKLGEQRIDLSNYPTRTELQEILNTALQDYLTKELFNGFLTDINQDISDIKTNTTQIVGKNNQFTAGGALSANEYGVAIGKNSTTDFGVSIGASSESLAGGAVGFGAKTSDGFSGGFNAKAQGENGNGIDAIQLGTGINSIPLSLQIYGDNIYKSTSHTLTVKNIELDGQDIKDLIGEGGGGSSSESSDLSLPVGSIFASAIPQTDSRVHLLDGSTISQTGVYETFSNLIKSLVSSGYNISCTQAQFDADVSATSNCGKFVIDNTAGTIRLPKITTFVQGLSNITNIGSSLSAGLPNITGQYGAHRLTDRAPVVSTGAFYDAGDTASTGQPNHQAGLSRTIGFDASKSNAIYGKSSTVQPNATQYPYYIVLASGYKSSQVVDIDNIINETNVIVKSYSMMPSSKWITGLFTNKAVGIYSYIPPANGWIMINFQFSTGQSANNGQVILWSEKTNTSSTQSCPAYGWNSCRVMIPVIKGDDVKFQIQGTALSNIWGSFFIYAQGQEV